MGDANSQGWTSLYQCPHLIVGVLGSLNEKGISHIQYADDIVLMTNGSNKSITNIKIMLYCFEWLSCININFHTSKSFCLASARGKRNESKHAKS